MKENFVNRFHRIQLQSATKLQIGGAVYDYSFLTLILGTNDLKAFKAQWGNPTGFYRKVEYSKKKYLIKFKL